MAEPDDDQTLRKKSAALKDALARRRAETGPRSGGEQAGGTTPDTSGAASGMSLGMRAASEFIAAVVVGGLMGWGLDRLFGTKPLFIIVFFLLGVAAGVLGVIRTTSPKGAP